MRERGWETEGNVAFEKTGDSTVCRLTAPALLRQQIPDVRDKQEMTVDRPGVYRTVFPHEGKIRLFALELETGTLAVDNLRLYSHIQNGLLYDPDNRPLAQRDNIKKMNEILAGQPNDP